MSWSCPHCGTLWSCPHCGKDSMKRHINNRHSNLDHFTPFNAMPYSTEKSQRFQFEHPFTCMVAGMTGSGKTVWVQSLLTQAYRMINLPPERIVWCYSQWQPTVTHSGHASHHTKHRICQGNPNGFRTRCLF